MFRVTQLVSLALFATFSMTAANAQPTTNPNAKHILVAPNCLIKNANAPFITLASQNNLSLIETNEQGVEKLIAAKEQRTTPCGGFIDVTHTWSKHPGIKPKNFLLDYIKPPKPAPRSYSIQHPNEVKIMMDLVNPNYMWTRLTSLTSYPDRYSRSDNGVKAANEIKAEVEALAAQYGRNDVSVYFVSTGSYIQPSVVAKIGASNEPGIVIGAHMDTLSSRIELKPGADDDGSGTVTVLEVARTLLSSGMYFQKPIYLAWYAAEEVGLVGSQYVVQDFKNKSIPVSEVMQLDMTGYAYKNDLTMWLLDDNVNMELTNFLDSLITNYVKTPVKHTTCGYACSDHASWTKGGFRAAAPFESSFYTYNPYIHTAKDTMEKLSLEHMTNFVYLALAFAVELAEPALIQ